MSGPAAPGATSRKSIATALPAPVRITANPPPAMLPAVGWVTASANAVATAASTALPPAARISWPTWLATFDSDATMLCLPVAVTAGSPSLSSAVRYTGLASTAAANGFWNPSVDAVGAALGAAVVAECGAATGWTGATGGGGGG